MKTICLTIFLLLLCFQPVAGQPDENAPILKTILTNYYKNEKAIYKGRNQLLFFYCEKSNNNEEIFETINSLKLPPAETKHLKNRVRSDTAPQNWASELQKVYSDDRSNLKIKLNNCLSLEEYQVKQKRFNLNNQRLMIVSKPLLYSDGKTALVKVVFYRSIEHNNGSVLLMEKVDGNWIIKEYLNSWST